MAGAELLLPGPAPHMPGRCCEFIAAERPTVTGAVPTILNDLLRAAERTRDDLSCFRLVFCGGSAVPRSMIEDFRDRHGVVHDPGVGNDRDQPAGHGQPGRRAAHPKAASTTS